MRRKNLMRLTAAMGMMMACSQVMQAAAPVWGNETVEETTAGSHDDLIEIPTLEDEEYPVDQGKQNYVGTIVQADNRIGSMLMEKLTAENENVFISSYSIAAALTLLSHCSESGEQIEQLKEFLGLNNMSESEILAAQEELAALLGTNKENQEDEEDEKEAHYHYERGLEEFVSYLKDNVQKDDIILTLGAGNVTKVADLLVK